jgi:hypothetical protein
LPRTGGAPKRTVKIFARSAIKVKRSEDSNRVLRSPPVKRSQADRKVLKLNQTHFFRATHVDVVVGSSSCLVQRSDLVATVVDRIAPRLRHGQFRRRQFINCGKAWLDKRNYDRAIADDAEGIRLNPNDALARSASIPNADEVVSGRRHSGTIDSCVRLSSPPSRGVRCTMRRSVTEWLFMSAVGCFLAAVALLACSSHPSWSAYPIEITQDQGGHRVYMLIRDGRASLSNQIDFNSPGSPKPWVVNPRNVVFPKVTANHQFSIPGLAFQICRFTTGTSVWSLDFSLAIPAALSSTAAAILVRLLSRYRRLRHA